MKIADGCKYIVIIAIYMIRIRYDTPHMRPIWDDAAFFLLSELSLDSDQRFAGKF